MADRKSPLERPGDIPEMINALRALEKAGVPYVRPTLHQLKSDSINFYPKRGKIHRDGELRAEAEVGVDAFIALIRQASGRPSGF